MSWELGKGVTSVSNVWIFFSSYIMYMKFKFSFFLMSGKICIKSDFLVLCCNKDENVIWSLLKSHFIFQFFLSSPQRDIMRLMMALFIFWCEADDGWKYENCKTSESLFEKPTPLKELGQILTSFQVDSEHSEEISPYWVFKI